MYSLCCPHLRAPSVKPTKLRCSVSHISNSSLSADSATLVDCLTWSLFWSACRLSSDGTHNFLTYSGSAAYILPSFEGALPTPVSLISMSHHKPDRYVSGSIQCHRSLRAPSTTLAQLTGCCICGAASSPISVSSSSVVVLCCLCVVSIGQRIHQNHFNVLLSNIQPSVQSEIRLTKFLKIISRMRLIHSKLPANGN